MQMPRELPGLYWDEEKQRYFPISARPAGQVPQPRAPQARSNARAGPSTGRKHAKSPLYAGISADLVSADSASASRRRVKGRFALSYGATNYAQIKRAQQCVFLECGFIGTNYIGIADRPWTTVCLVCQKGRHSGMATATSLLYM